jgi:hypothetical protein
MKPFSPVRLSLIAGLNDTDPNQPTMRQKLEAELQGWLDRFCRMEDSNCSVLIILLESGWLLGCGRKVRFEIRCSEIGADGEVKGIEVESVEELKNLIGGGKTPKTLLEALASVGELQLSAESAL